MAVKYHINEIDIFKFIADTFNNNSSNGVVKFSIGYYFLDDDSGNMGGFTKRFTQQGGRFDLKDTYDDDTMELKNESFVPMGVYNLNANYLAHDIIKEITYEPTIEMLVYIESDITYKVIDLVIQEIRAKLIQHQTTLNVKFKNLEATNAEDMYIEETLKVITMSGEIDYGQIVRIQGKSYLTVSMPLILAITNHGEFTNQEKIELSVPSVENGDFIEIQPITWGWGVGIDTTGSQLLNDKSVSNSRRADQVLHVPNTTAFGFGIAIQIDFRNPILKKIFKDSRNPKKQNTIETWTIKSTIKTYDYNKLSPTYGQYVIDNDLTLNEDFIIDKNAPIEELSKGEKYIFALSFTPKWKALI